MLTPMGSNSVIIKSSLSKRWCLGELGSHVKGSQGPLNQALVPMQEYRAIDTRDSDGKNWIFVGDLFIFKL